jgi:hypothetical protein
MCPNFAPAFLATAGWAEQDDFWAIVLLMTFRGILTPFFLIGQGVWLSLLGVCILGVDIAVMIAIGRPIYRILYQRWHVPEWLIAIPLLPVPMIVAALINVIALWVLVMLSPNLDGG